MSQLNRATYTQILGRDPKTGPRERAIVVAIKLPRPGEHGFRWVSAKEVGKEYAHFGYRIHEKASPVNIHLYGVRNLIERMAKTGSLVVCEVELIVKKTESEREFIFANLHLVAPHRKITHEFCVCPAPKERPWFVYTTPDMHGIGLCVKPL